MTQSQQIWSVILFYGAAQGLFIAGALLAVRRGRRLANRFLAAMVLAATAGVTSWFLVASGLIRHVPVMALAPVFLDATLGPLFYFYARTLLQPEYKPKSWIVAVVILVPALFRYATMHIRGFDLQAGIAVLERLRDSEFMPINPAPLIYPALLTAYSLVFMYLAWRHLRLVESMCADEFSSDACAHIRWLKVLSVCVFTFGIAVVVFLINLAVMQRWYAWLEYAESLVRGLLIQAVAVAVFFVPEAFSKDLGELSNRRRRLVIDDNSSSRYLEQLQQYMETAKPYRSEDLRLGDLADKIGVSAHVLSQLINDHLHTNFSDFVNRYRVDETQDLMQRTDNDQFTLLAIARDAGFNSKSSFYRAFRKHAGMSPSEYRFLARQSGRAAAE